MTIYFCNLLFQFNLFVAVPLLINFRKHNRQRSQMNCCTHVTLFWLYENKKNRKFQIFTFLTFFFTFSPFKPSSHDIKNTTRPASFLTVLSGQINTHPTTDTNMLDLTFETTVEGQIEFSLILYKMMAYVDPLWMKSTQVLVLDNPFQERHNNLRKRIFHLFSLSSAFFSCFFE